MNKYKNFEEKLAKREKIVGPVIQNISSTVIIERMCDSVDFLLFDGEHGIFNNENLIECLQVARLKSTPALVRVADTVYHLISRALYLGADGIMIPRCETVEQVKTAIDSMNFPTVGKLGCGGHGQYRQGEDIFSFKRYLFLQIESPTGIANLPHILKSYGEYISAVIIGPYDLSVMLNKPFDFEDKGFLESVETVFDICKQNNISSGIFCDDEKKAEKYRKMGANVLWTGTDINMLMRGFNETYNALKKI